MKNVVAALLSLTLVFGLGACEQNGANAGDSIAASIDAMSGSVLSTSERSDNNAPSDDAAAQVGGQNLASGATDAGAPPLGIFDAPASADPAALDAYRAVLLENADFYSPVSNEYLSIGDYTKSEYEYGIHVLFKFTAIDLDHDGTPEVVLCFSNKGTISDGATDFLILHFYNGIVYGYSLWYRAFERLKADGTFSFSGGAADNGLGVMQFADDTYVSEGYPIVKITYCMSSQNADGTSGVSFFVNQQPATEEEYSLAIAQQDSKPDANWHDFTGDNIDLVLCVN